MIFDDDMHFQIGIKTEHEKNIKNVIKNLSILKCKIICKRQKTDDESFFLQTKKMCENL